MACLICLKQINRAVDSASRRFLKEHCQTMDAAEETLKVS
jgi:hypothetical protein